MAPAANAVQAWGSKNHTAVCAPAGQSAVAECLHSAMQIIGSLICWCHELPPMERQKRLANTAEWWITVCAEKSFGAANCQEGSNICGLCPMPKEKQEHASPSEYASKCCTLAGTLALCAKGT